MPELTPFPALRYTREAGDLARLLAPPYDVIDGPQADELRKRSPHNCVRLILPSGPTPEKYELAARTLRSWIETGVLAEDPTPSVYVYRQRFDLDGEPAERLALFAALRLTPLDAGDVLPHERTHAGPKKDRLALTLATRTQLSPVFMVARDGDAVVYDRLRRVAGTAPTAGARTPDGIEHALWRVDDDRRDPLLAAAGADPLLIADGHHRYETALAARGGLGDNVKAAYILVCLVSQRDPGLAVRPTHRLLSRGPEGSPQGYDWRAALAPAFDLRSLGGLDAVAAERAAATGPAGCLVVATGGSAGGDLWMAEPHAEPLRVAGVTEHAARIAPAVFDGLVLRRLYGQSADAAAEQGILSYARQPQVAAAPPPGGCGFLLPPVSLDDVWATAGDGGRLPPKSTYFEPKMPSGLLFRPL